jgi:uncharacterized protein (TIRG00374 family)
MNETKKTSLAGNLLKYVVPLIISIGLCYLLFTGIDFKEMMDIIRRECDFRWIGLTLIISIFSHIFRAMRWRIQLKALNIEASLFALTLSIFGTYAVNLVFPRLGEVWRTGYIAQRERAPFATVFGSMVADRLADTVTVLLLTIITFLLASKALISFISENAESYMGIVNTLTSPWLWLAIVACIAAIWWFLTRKTDNKLVVKLQTALKGLWEGFSAILTMPGKAKWFVLTFCIWGCYFSQLYVAFYAFPFTSEILAQHGILVALVAFVLSSISMGVPSNGGIGPWQWAIIFALGIYGLDKANAGAFANLVLGMQTLLLIALGIFTFAAIALDKKRVNKRNITNNI